MLTEQKLMEQTAAVVPRYACVAVCLLRIDLL